MQNFLWTLPTLQKYSVGHQSIINDAEKFNEIGSSGNTLRCNLTVDQGTGDSPSVAGLEEAAVEKCFHPEGNFSTMIMVVHEFLFVCLF